MTGPDYVRIDVEAEIGLDSLDSGDVELAATIALRDYLHPLTGGPPEPDGSSDDGCGHRNCIRCSNPCRECAASRAWK